ncbi:MAG: HPr kinase/phosphorylase [Caulobacteraceae bacterium]|nr:HPr kinase/phosphorylase [Caulobacteraceae bacterium]
MTRHAGLLALRRNRRWEGALIEGPSGAGKSGLALRALAEGFRLVADDRVIVWASGGALYGRAPPPLAGLIEARGVDVLPEAAVAFARIALLVEDGAGERIPEPATTELCGLAVPRLTLCLSDPAAPAKLRRALAHLGSRR